MTTFIGYNTIGAYRKTTLTNTDLVVRDLLNAFNIKQGQVPGKPEVGCPIWSYLYEDNSVSTRNDMLQVLNNTISQDPRIILQNINPTFENNGVNFEIELRVTTDVSPTQLNVFFDVNSQTASLVSYRTIALTTAQ